MAVARHMTAWPASMPAVRDPTGGPPLPPRPARAGGSQFAHVGVGCIIAGIALLTVASRPSVPLLSLGFLVVALLLAVRTTTERSLAVGYTAVVAVSFVLAPLMKGQIASTASTVWFILGLWFVGWSLGQYVMTRLLPSSAPRAVPAARASVDPLLRQAVLVVGVLSLVVQWMLVRSGAVGYGAQARGVVSIGPLAMFASVGPAALASAYVTARLQQASLERRALMLVLLLLQAVALAATGFKGAGPIYLLTVWLVAKRWIPMARLEPRRVVAVGAAAVVMLVLFNFAAGVRQQIVEARIGSAVSSSSGLAGIAATPALALKRLDLLVSADAAVERADLRDAQETVSVGSQLVAFIPRALWPNKPTSSYGQEVSYVFFDIPKMYRTSSSITWIGDLFVQGGSVLILMVSVLVGVVFSQILRWRSRPDPVSVAFYFLAVQVLLTVELPLLISFATALRALLAFVLALLGARLALRIMNGQRTPGVIRAPSGTTVPLG